MRFSIEEAEFINNFLFDVNLDNYRKEDAIKLLSDAKNNTEKPELVSIAENTITKLNALDELQLKNIFSSIPLNSFTNY